MKNLSAVAFVALVFGASPALAADGSGGRFEARIGAERLLLDARLTDGVDVIDGSSHDSGVSLGIEGGYDLPLGKAAIIGAYAGIEGGTTKDCTTQGTIEDCLLVGRNLTLGGRIGVRVTPQVTLYGKAGYSNGQLRVTEYDSTDPTVIWKGKENTGGYHFGGGVEASLGSNTYIRGEYVRTNYSKYKDSADGIDLTLDSRLDQLLMGFGIRF